MDSNAKGAKISFSDVFESIKGYLETFDQIEILHSSKRGYIILRWDSLVGAYYGIDSIESPEQLAMYIYGEIIGRITIETKSDHNLKNMDFDEFELDEAKAVTRKFLSVLPKQVKKRLCERLDPETGLILGKDFFAKNLLG